jgi:NitT/TauT family transport system substrate-binding protein
MRRQLAALTLLATAATVLAGCSTATPGGGDDKPAPAELTPMTWQLDIAPAGRHAPFYLAKELGYYEEAGLDVTIQAGQGSGAATTNVAAGSVDAAFVSVGAAAIAKREDASAPIAYVADIYARAPYTVYSLKDGADIEKPEDLKGNCVSASETSTIWQQMDAWAEKEGYTGYEWCYRAEDTRGQLLMTGEIDSILSFTLSEPPLRQLAERSGQELVGLPLGDYGFSPFLSNGILVNTDFAEANPEAVTAFIEATLKAYEYTFEHPQEAADIIAGQFPTLDPEITVAELGLVQVEVTNDGKKSDLGCFTIDDVLSSIDLTLGEGHGIDPESVVSMDYFPDGMCS